MTDHSDRASVALQKRRLRSDAQRAYYCLGTRLETPLAYLFTSSTFFDFLPASALQSGEFLLQKTFYSKRLPTPKGQSHDAQSPTDAAGKVWPPSFFPSSLLAPTLRAIPSSIGVILTCSRARPSSAPSTCPRPQAFRARPALSFTRPQQVCPAFFAHPLASSSAALGRDKEWPKQLR